jgi:hypothetical protein
MKTPANPLGFDTWFVTLRIETPVIPPDTALIEVNPAFWPPGKPTLVACPDALTVAAPVFVDDHVALAVRSFVVPSL